MGIELHNWMGQLKQISELPRVSDLGQYPSDDVTYEIERAFSDAVLTLFNNSLRAAGIPCSDTMSESNWSVISKRIGAELGSEIRARLPLLRSDAIKRGEVEADAIQAEIHRLQVARNAAHAEMKSFDADIETRKQKLKNLQGEINKLKRDSEV